MTAKRPIARCGGDLMLRASRGLLLLLMDPVEFMCDWNPPKAAQQGIAKQ